MSTTTTRLEWENVSNLSDGAKDGPNYYHILRFDYRRINNPTEYSLWLIDDIGKDMQKSHGELGRYASMQEAKQAAQDHSDARKGTKQCTDQ